MVANIRLSEAQTLAQTEANVGGRRHSLHQIILAGGLLSQSQAVQKLVIVSLGEILQFSIDSSLKLITY